MSIKENEVILKLETLIAEGRSFMLAFSEAVEKIAVELELTKEKEKEPKGKQLFRVLINRQDERNIIFTVHALALKRTCYKESRTTDSRSSSYMICQNNASMEDLEFLSMSIKHEQMFDDFDKLIEFLLSNSLITSNEISYLSSKLLIK